MEKTLKRVEGLRNYNGSKSIDVVDLAGSGTVASEQKAAERRKISVTIENLTASDKKVLIFNPDVDMDYSAVNALSDVVAEEGTVDDGAESPTDLIKVTSARGNWNLTKHYLTQNPSAILKMRITATNTSDDSVNTAQLTETITRNVYTPFDAQVLKANEINLNDHLHRNQFQSGFVDVYDGFVVDANGLVTMNILAGVKVKIDFFFGPAFNSGKALEKFADSSGIMVRKSAM